MALFIYLLPILAMLGTSFLYFQNSEESPMPRRIVTSAHGLVGAVLYFIALSASVIGSNTSEHAEHMTVLLCLFSIPYVLIVISLIGYRGYKPVHLLQLLQIPAMLLANFFGLVGLRFAI